jgi:hypothetical protein
MNTEETPELEAELSDLLRMVTRMGEAPRLGKEWRELALAITNAAGDVEKMSGLVLDGEVYNVRVEQHWAPCGCRDGKHRFSRDGWFGRAGWLDDREEAEKRKDRVRGHIVTRLVAATSLEVVQ